MRAKLFAPEEIKAIAPEWEQLVKENEASGFMQSLSWAGFKQTQQLTSVPIGVFEGEKLIGGAIFYSADLHKGTGFMVAPDGPVLPWKDEEYSRAALRELVACAEEFANDHGQIALRIQPRLSPPALIDECEFGRAPVDLTPRETLFLDLTAEENRLLSEMKHKTRYNIRLSARRGVQVYERYDGQALDTFYRLMLEAASRDGFYVEPLQFFQSLVKELAPSGMIRIFFAQHDEDVLGALMMLTYGKRSTYLYGGISNSKRNLMPGYALQWAAITAAKKAGSTEYDFYGYDQLQSPFNTYAKFSRFKSGFGGRAVRYVGALDYFCLDTLTDAIIKAVGEVDWQEFDDEPDAVACGDRYEALQEHRGVPCG